MGDMRARTARLLVLPLLAGLIGASGQQPEWERHRAAGVAAGRADFPGIAALCTSPPPPRVTRELVLSRPWSMPPAYAPAKVFDDLFFVGSRGVAAWVIRTPAGLVLIDTLNNAQEAQAFIEPGLRQLGLDPAQIKLVIITHGHGDHTGGLGYLVEKYRPHVVMSRVDWDMTRDPATRIDAPGWSDFPRPDRLVAGRETIRFGGVRFDLRVTPGHTPGTLSLIFPVTQGGKPHHVVLWGGTGFNFGDEIARYQIYARSAEAMRRKVVRRKIDVFISNHPPRDGADAKIAALRAGPPGAPNPFVLTPARVANGFVTLRECALAQAGQLAARTAK